MRSGLLKIFMVISLATASASAAAGEPALSRQAEWEQTLKAAEKEGQVTVYISGYEAVLASDSSRRPIQKSASRACRDRAPNSRRA